MKAKWMFILSLVMVLLLSACGGKNTAIEPVSQETDEEVVEAVEQEAVEEDEEEYRVVEIENEDHVLVFKEVPQRAVTLNQHVTEIMLALGLEDHMVGTAYLDDEILPEFKEAYEKIPVLSDRYPSQEVFLSVEPDFAYAGWRSAFREDNVGTVEELANFGINGYLHHSSAKVGPTLDDIFLDIRNIAKIFNVVDRGDALIANITSELEKIQANVPQNEEPLRVFVFDSGDTAAFTSAQGFLNSIITMAGATNIFSEIDKNWAEVSWEEIVERDPEVIVINDYGETSLEDKMNFLLNHPALTDVSAIKNEKFIVMPLSAAAEGIRTSHALEILVNGLYQ